MKEKKLRLILEILKVIESIYLLTFFVIIFAYKFPPAALASFTQFWVAVSFMLLPVFLLKNIIVGVVENRLLDNKEKAWLIVRCIIYILLAIYSYPLIANTGFCY